MRNKNGFTLIELIVVIITITVIVGGFAFIWSIPNANQDVAQYPVNDAVQQQCISGFKFVLSSNGSLAQILDESGNGISCH